MLTTGQEIILGYPKYVMWETLLAEFGQWRWQCFQDGGGITAARLFARQGLVDPDCGETPEALQAVAFGNAR